MAKRMSSAEELPSLLQAFFTDRLMQQRRASAHTICAYRDAFRLLLSFAARQFGKEPSALLLADLNADFVSDFLNHLEADRGNAARTRNARLAAIHSFFRYAAFRRPDVAGQIQRVLAIPSKRHERRQVGHLDRSELEALLSAPPRESWQGRRDHAMFLLMSQAGLRVSELTGLCRKHVHVGRGAHVQCHGKGRKERSVPLTQEAVTTLRSWLREQDGTPDDPLFPSMHRTRLSADGVQSALRKHVAVARLACPSLAAKRVSPHVLRHSNAVHLLQSGVDRSVIALWLGHESAETTQIYIDADLKFKQKILESAGPPKGRGQGGRFRPGDRLLAFLKTL